MRRQNFVVLTERELTKEEIEEYHRQGYQFIGYARLFSKYHYYFKKINELPRNNK